MANAILVVGDTGTGKSSSMYGDPELGIKGLDPKETFIVNVKGKPLPFKGWKAQYKNCPDGAPPTTGNYIATTNPDVITNYIKFVGQNRPDIKNIVIDDYQYILAQSFMAKAMQGGFDKFNLLAKQGFDVLDAGISLPEDKNFIVLTHDDEENGKAKMKLLGRMLEDKVNPIGLFTMALFTTTKTSLQGKTTYHFITNRVYDERSILIPAKTPRGMFDDSLIPNDLGLVLDKMNEFNNFGLEAE